ncbi:hypothetical protein RND71_030638 [Anisodus tanguticus]|uniref:Uncharacterized protein n=1 Tax=Anisodus tanguticus TaxID=243964 RepID=A0AAE1V8F3_9SOLA|nr:hypothetical protein RND71_030638 [Anisodus tanguticus]
MAHYDHIRYEYRVPATPHLSWVVTHLASLSNHRTHTNEVWNMKNDIKSSKGRIYRPAHFRPYTSLSEIHNTTLSRIELSSGHRTPPPKTTQKVVSRVQPKVKMRIEPNKRIHLIVEKVRDDWGVRLEDNDQHHGMEQVVQEHVGRMDRALGEFESHISRGYALIFLPDNITLTPTPNRLSDAESELALPSDERSWDAITRITKQMFILEQTETGVFRSGGSMVANRGFSWVTEQGMVVRTGWFGDENSSGMVGQWWFHVVERLVVR